jgi:oligoendopeptidase F
MISSLPKTAIDFMNWDWRQIEPYFNDLRSRTLTHSGVMDWLSDWSRIRELVEESRWRHYVAKTLDTMNEGAGERYINFLEQVYSPTEKADQELKQMLLSSGFKPEGFDIQLRNMRTEADLFREENLPLLNEDRKLASGYDKIVGAQTVEWEGDELTLIQLRPILMDPERSKRESAWRLAAARQLADREAINNLWIRLLEIRRQITENAQLSDYRTYRWRKLLRFDYTPKDCSRFHKAIEDVAVPAAMRIYDRRRERLGLKSLRPWDLIVDALKRPPLKPFSETGELETKASNIFQRVDPQLGSYFEIMRQEDLLDLDNRKGKAPGAYCVMFYAARRPFIFMNAVGLHEDVQTILHEAGHAFHDFEISQLPYYHQKKLAMEFAEVGSMAMELLAVPYLNADEGGFYSPKDAARARIEHLEESILFWPYMAVVDAFQHWVYENIARAVEPANCDEKWGELWMRFMPGVDWSDLEREMVTGWHRKLHLYHEPFYYIEYGLAQLGAVHVWKNALQDQAQAVVQYREALSKGGTLPLPELYRIAGANLSFDAQTLSEVVSLMEHTIDELEAI